VQEFMVGIRALGERDAPIWWDLRRKALSSEPFAFGQSVEEHEAAGVEWIAKRFREMPADSFTLGAFDGDTLIGMATFLRDQGDKHRHKGRIFGVYVSAGHQGKNVGSELMAALLRRAAEDPSLEQILLAVAVGQDAAHRLYQKFGFERYGTERRSLKVRSAYVDEDLMMLRVR
jgi:RimJ/RimL family protein N-acetyltransferase